MDSFKSTPRGLIGSELPKLDLSVLQQLQDPFHRFNMTARSQTFEERDALKESARNTYRPAISPAWLKHDREVLKFTAYFQEPVHENPKETYRIRCCSILFYLEDGTMMVSEPKIENSGIPQGTFVKRHRIPKPRGLGEGFYTYNDLRVGITISVYARNFRIIGCDEFTRYFYENSLGQVLDQNEEPPLDSFRAADVQDSQQFSPRNQAMLEIKEYNNIALGGNRRNEKLQQYLDNDRKVLRFQCYWDDASRYGARMYYTLHYYLADDTIEMLENLPRNAGRDPYPVFWRKSVLRKNPYVSPAPGMQEPEPIIYKPEDLIVGEVVAVIGRDIVLYDCDKFTRDFYRQYMGFEQESITIQGPQLVHSKLTHPPHNGFGSEEDSLASCLRLTPRPPRRDIKKLLVDADKVMRFEARMVNDRLEDDNRRFIVAIYLADNSVCVWELKQRNSGHSEGKFAVKSKKQNPATGTSFQPADFYIGAVLEVTACPFLLTGADEAALVYMEEHVDEFPYMNCDIILSKIERLVKYLETVDGMISIRDFPRLVEDRIKVQLVDHEVIALARMFGDYTSDPDRPIEAAIDPKQIVQAFR